MHRLLNRQLKKSFGKDFELDSLDPKLQKLFYQVSEIYNHNDEQRRSLEHIIAVNSEELKKAHDDIKEKNESLQKLLEEKSKNLDTKEIENRNIGNLLKQYKNAMDQSLIVSIMDTNGFITYVNKNFCDITGYKSEEILNKTHDILKTSTENSSFYDDMWEKLKKKGIWNGTTSHLNKNSEIFYIKSTIVPLLDKDGNIKEYITLSDDVSKEVIYQEKLELQTQRINTIFNSQENITIIVKPKVGIIDVNYKFFRTFGFKDLDDYHKNVPCICKMFEETKTTTECGKKIEYKWFQNFLENINHVNKITYIDKYGNDIIFNIYCKKILLDKEEHYLSTLVDITELEHAREKSEIAEKAKTTFLANMSHEIRTPLNAIIGFSNILCESDLEKTQHEHSNIISKNAESLLEIINDVLDISKIESGKLELVYKSFPINDLMESIIELFSIKAKEKDIRFIYDVDSKIPFSIISDSTRLRQVISNLLSNAIKFTPNYGSIKFSLKVLEKSNSNVKIRFSIKDDGIGIDSKHQEKIFTPFSQADDAINREFGGTGLGLTISQDIINLMNSKIELTSKINEGAKFSFDLEFKIDKEIDESIKNYTNLKFAITEIADDKEYLRSNVKTYLNKIANVIELNENSYKEKIDLLFCFENINLEKILTKFKDFNPNSKIIYVGNRQSKIIGNIENLVNYYLDLPIYGSKIYNIISDNSKINEEIISTIEDNKTNTLDKYVLVAEDNTNNQLLIELLLEKLGLKFKIASNGEEAVQFYKNEKFDIILMDINMPIKDGVSATKDILSYEKTNNHYKVPIIALTANSIVGDREKYLESGMDDYLSKPINFDELKKVIFKYI